jgi:PIN domain nuclease of toxin-antitoxin system
MIIMDKHIWLWWVNEDIDILGQSRNDLIQSEEMVAVSAISCFEVAWLDAHNRIELPCNRTNWFEKALEGSDINIRAIGIRRCQTGSDPNCQTGSDPN